MVYFTCDNAISKCNRSTTCEGQPRRRWRMICVVDLWCPRRRSTAARQGLLKKKVSRLMRTLWMILFPPLLQWFSSTPPKNDMELFKNPPWMSRCISYGSTEIFHPPNQLTYLLYKLYGPLGTMFQQVTNMPTKRGGGEHCFSPIHIKFHGSFHGIISNTFLWPFGPQNSSTTVAKHHHGYLM